MTFTLLNGKLVLEGPSPAEDALWLAASVPDHPHGTRVLDAACGIGTVGLALLTRQPNLTVTGVEIDATLAAHASANAQHNHVPFTAIRADLFEWQPEEPFPLILCNPPFYGQEHGHTSPSAENLRTRSLPAGGLTRWLTRLVSFAAPGAHLHLILHTQNEEELTSFARQHNAFLTLTPLQTAAGKSPKRLLADLHLGKAFALTTNQPLETFNAELREKILRNASALFEV